MKNIIIGIDENSNISQLLNDGIKEYYFGFVPQDFIQTYSTQTSLNRRYRLKEQFSNSEKIIKTINEIHNNNAIIYLALNSFTSNEILKDYSLKVFEMFKDMVDGVIVANVTIATMLQKQNYKNIIISNLFGVYSVNAVKFLIEQFNPTKIILPRDIRLQDIQKIVTTFPKMQFECFLYGDNCRYSESFCFSEHGYDSVGFGSLCSFAFENKKLVGVSNPAYKQILKDTKLTKQEKKEILKTRHLDISSLLDELELYSYEFDSKKITKILDTLSLYDTKAFYTDKKVFIRALNILKTLEYPKSQELQEKINNCINNETDNYKMFHKLNTKAIKETLKFFNKYENIVSYKIPSRGRELYKYIFMLDNDEQYNYKQSQYRL
jgi:hypothetical protein